MLDLSESRAQIDVIDKEITRLFQKRIDVCRDVAAYKIQNNKKVLDKTRENQKLEALSKFAEDGFKEHGICDLFTQVMAICRKRQYQIMKEEGVAQPVPFDCVDEIDKTNATVVFQGVEGAYSHAASMAYFGDLATYFHVPNFEEVMKAVANKEADFGVLPLENSSAGQVGDVYDLLTRYDNTIVGEYYLPVRHCLLGLKGADIDKIKTVYSHPQGLMQCGKFLNEHSSWQQISQANTAMAAQKVIKENNPNTAAIASETAAKLYGLEILEEGINDNKTNTTRFIIVSRKKCYRRDASKISIMFEIPHESGSLYTILSHMIYNDLNMTKIESRPIPEQPFEYRFFVDFEGNLADAAVENAILGIKEEAARLKILGNY